MSAFFSVVIPVYNAERYINECVESVINQDYQNYEIILVDDGSRDKSPDMCDDLVLLYPERIRVFHQKNSGQFIARINGFKQARGDYIVNLDSDDMLEVHALSCLNRIFSDQNVDMIIYTLSSADNRGEYLKSTNSVFSRGIVPKDILMKKLITSSKLNSVCLKSFVRKQYHFEQKRRLSHGEDYYMSLMLLDDIQTIWYEPTSLYRYRFNASSATNSRDVFSYRDYLYLADYTINYILARNIDSVLIEEYLNQFTKTISVALMNICLGKTKSRYEILANLHQEKLIRQCEQYVKNSTIRDKIPLLLFYQERYRILTFYEYLYYLLISRAVSIKRAFVHEKKTNS